MVKESPNVVKWMEAYIDESNRTLVDIFNNPKIISMIEDCLFDCEKKSLYGETHGAVLRDREENSLVFREILSENQKEINKYLEEYIDGDFSHLDEIKKEGEKILFSCKESSPDKECDPDLVYFVTFFSEELLAEPSRSRGARKIAVKRFRENILSSYVSCGVDELPLEDPCFLGTYHIHNGGSPPSEPDIELSKKLTFPNFVISKTKEGFDVYSLFFGKVKKILSHSEGVGKND